MGRVRWCDGWKCVYKLVAAAAAAIAAAAAAAAVAAGGGSNALRVWGSPVAARTLKEILGRHGIPVSLPAAEPLSGSRQPTVRLAPAEPLPPAEPAGVWRMGADAVQGAANVFRLEVGPGQRERRERAWCGLGCMKWAVSRSYMGRWGEGSGVGRSGGDA